MLSSGVLICLAAFPGLPGIPFLLMGGGLGAAAWTMKKKVKQVSAEAAIAQPKATRENLEDLLRVEPLSVEVGVGLISFLTGGANSQLLKRIGGIRKQLATDLGFIIPPVRVADNLALRAREYSICLKGVEMARFELPPGMELAIALTATENPPEGKPTKDPAFGVAAWWVPTSLAEKTRSMGYTVIDPLSVISTHLSELIKRTAHELFSRQEREARASAGSGEAADNPKVVEDLVPESCCRWWRCSDSFRICCASACRCAMRSRFWKLLVRPLRRLQKIQCC